MTEAAKLEKGEESAHARYLKLGQFLKRRDKEIDEVFGDLRRSTAHLQVALAVRKRIITRAELERFSEDTREVVMKLAEGF